MAKKAAKAKQARKLTAKSESGHLLSASHEAFAQGVAEGKSAAASYREHIATGPITIESAISAASRLMADVNVRLRVAELRKGFSEVLEHTLGFRQETVARFLVGVIETPIGEVGEESALCQEFRRTRKMVGRGEEAEEWEIEMVKMPAKLDAIEKLNKMAGWYEPEKHQLEVNVVIGGNTDADSHD